MQRFARTGWWLCPLLLNCSALAPLRLVVRTCGTCATTNFDAHRALDGLAKSSANAEVTQGACDGACAGPSVSVEIDGEPAVFGANAMTADERDRRHFQNVGDVDSAARVWTAASELRERLAAFAVPEAPSSPGSSAGFYGEDELQGILAMHEQLLDAVEPSEPPVDEEGVLGLHEIVRQMVEGDDSDVSRS